MNTKGFTLVELIAIIVVLTAIFLISFPSLLNSVKDNKEKQYENMINDLCLAGKSYIYSNMDIYPIDKVGEKITVSINQLINYGNVDKTLKNPKTNNLVRNDVLIYSVLNDYSLDCQYKEG